jgi:hypothetical protein
VTVRLCPAIVSVAVRGVFARFAVRVSVTLPGPDPPPVMVNHDGAPDADQPHPVCVVTLTLEVPPDARAVTFAGDTE